MFSTPGIYQVSSHNCLDTLVERLIKTPEDDAFLAQITHAQSLAILRLYDNTDAETAQLALP